MITNMRTENLITYLLLPGDVFVEIKAFLSATAFSQ
jgi:hypothetical protein